MAFRLVTEWSTDDPALASTLRDLNALPELSVERQEAEAQLHMIQARECWRAADRIRARQRDAERREERREQRAREKEEAK